MSEYLTKQEFTSFTKGLYATMRQNTREIIEHFNQSQSQQNVSLDRLENGLQSVSDDVVTIKVAVLDLTNTDRHLHNLVDELHDKGVAVNKKRIFS
ncbi:MAG: hypothetical protein WCV85_03820 [Patescibacteria group bacterium]|jgi:hypothetical protein